MASTQPSWAGLLGRGAAALALVHLTYNPEGFDFFHWVLQPKPGETGVGAYVHSLTPLKVLVGIALVTAWVIFLQATRRSLGVGGALLVIALFGCTIWSMIYYGAISPSSSRAIIHLVLLAISLVLAIGVSWSHVTQRLTGQQDTDRVA